MESLASKPERENFRNFWEEILEKAGVHNHTLLEQYLKFRDQYDPYKTDKSVLVFIEERFKELYRF